MKKYLVSADTVTGITLTTEPTNTNACFFVDNISSKDDGLFPMIAELTDKDLDAIEAKGYTFKGIR